VTDKLGIYEFDTKSKKIVAQHQFPDGFVSTPFASPEGDYVVIFGIDGGKRCRIIEAGESGQPSHIAWDLELDFDVTLDPEDNVFSDFAYIERTTPGGGKINMFMLSSSQENKVAIIDVSSGTPKVDYVIFRDGPPGPPDARLRDRQVEHVDGTPFVWITSRPWNELYVINIETKELVRTITEVNARKLLSVVNYEHLRLYGAIREGAISSMAMSTASAASANSGSSSDDDSSSSNALSVAAIALSLVAIVAVLANVAILHKQSQSNQEKFSAAQTRSLTGAGDASVDASLPSIK